MIITIDIEQQNNVSIAASFIPFFHSNHFDIHLALPKNDDDDDDDDDDNEHERVFQQVRQSARRIDQTHYENINKRKFSTDNESTNKKSKQCSECSKSFLNRTSLIHHRQHEQHHQVKSSKSTLRPGSSTQNLLERRRHVTDTSSLSYCSIKFVLSNEFLHE
ncbi:unnamed protein product [Rotaria sp. Silwood2]|nr:unnamed protein product [Rotaria sp. Silwood2]CAF3074604.1 unnamed protein product [Rotaria sp. Silwood2]CAF3357918.1 unnamed protein product [Rotaria sp. Silwood2]CAF4163155.1 unnamed protein product [Rotaria sp. Silwood2]CAF4240502.1 unnamed protein product [Rotaria sp. Silwood2]